MIVIALFCDFVFCCFFRGGGSKITSCTRGVKVKVVCRGRGSRRSHYLSPSWKILIVHQVILGSRVRIEVRYAIQQSIRLELTLI